MHQNASKNNFYTTYFSSSFSSSSSFIALFSPHLCSFIFNQFSSILGGLIRNKGSREVISSIMFSFFSFLRFLTSTKAISNPSSSPICLITISWAGKLKAHTLQRENQNSYVDHEQHKYG